MIELARNVQTPFTDSSAIGHDPRFSGTAAEEAHLGERQYAPAADQKRFLMVNGDVGGAARDLSVIFQLA